jgi:hypothetical protein
VQFRVIELTGDPCPDEATARILRQAGQHSGVLAVAISERIQAIAVTDWVDRLRKASGELKTLHPGLEAGDGDALALLQRGADLLQQGLAARTCRPTPWLPGLRLGSRPSAGQRSIARRCACSRCWTGS